MSEWYKHVQIIVEQIDNCIKEEKDEALTLRILAESIGYSEYHTSRMFREISGMTLKDYIRHRKLAFALKEIRDTQNKILDIAVKYGFSSNEAFSRAFKNTYGISPSEYLINPMPVVIRTILKPFDCYLMEGAMRNMNQKESQIPGQDCETICGLLDSIKGNLDDVGGTEQNAGSGQLMAWINEPTGRICSWGIPLAEAYGIRLPADFNDEIPDQMILMDVPEGEYIVFEHGPFDFETESQSVEMKIEAAVKDFDYCADGYQLDMTPGRVFYFYHDCERFFKYVRPVCKR